MYEGMKAEIEKQKRLKNLNNADIARAIGRAKNTVDIFMMKKSPRDSKALAEDIAAYLGIEVTESEDTE